MAKATLTHVKGGEVLEIDMLKNVGDVIYIVYKADSGDFKLDGNMKVTIESGGSSVDGLVLPYDGGKGDKSTSPPWSTEQNPKLSYYQRVWLQKKLQTPKGTGLQGEEVPNDSPQQQAEDAQKEH